jgi:hypothetical protein
MSYLCVYIVLETKIILRKGDENMGPLGANVGSSNTYMLHPSLGLFLSFLVVGFKARAPSDREHNTSTQKLYSGGSKHIYTGVFQYRQC